MGENWEKREENWEKMERNWKKYKEMRGMVEENVRKWGKMEGNG